MAHFDRRYIMQITFKLTAAQNQIAAAVRQNLLNLADEWDEFFGNLLLQQVHPCTNTDQSLDWNGDARTLTYKGQRHPLVQYGALTTIRKICRNNPHVVDYQTSDKRLHWYETLSDYLWYRGTAEECIEAGVYPPRHAWIEKGVVVLRDHPARASAQYTGAEMRLIRAAAL
jgi:hypothetical protein